MADTLELSKEEQDLLNQMRADDAQRGAPESVPAVEPQAESAPTAPTEPTPPATAQSPEVDPQRYVPLHTLSEERQRRQKVEEDLAAERERIKTLEERTNLLLQQWQQRQEQRIQAQTEQPAEAPKPPPIPDLDKDPVGHIIGRQMDFDRRLAEQGQSWQQQQTQYQQQIQAQQALTQLVQGAQALESQFVVEHPDYSAAVQYLKQARHRELELVGRRNPVEREQIIQQEGLGVAASMMQSGGNPAAALYELARMRGYQPPASPNSVASNGAPGHIQEAALNPGVAQPEPPPQGADTAPGPRAQAPTPQQRLATLQQGQEQARSLGAARGGGPVPLTAQRLIDMTDAEFEKALATPEGMELLGA